MGAGVTDPDERLDVDQAAERLNQALALQYRSSLALTLAAGSVFGLQYQGLGDHLWRFASAELEDARRLVEKLGALGREPTTEVPEVRWTADMGEAVSYLIEIEEEAIASLQEAIEPTGREGRSEALEHLLEHLILRKQDQVDFLIRANRG